MQIICTSLQTDNHASRLVGWSLTSLFSTNTVISETRPHQYLTTQVLQAVCPFCRPAISVSTVGTSTEGTSCCRTISKKKRSLMFWDVTWASIVWLKSFLPHDAMLAWYMPSSCVCLSQVGLVLKQLNVGSCKQRHTIAQRLSWCQRSPQNSQGHPNGDAKCR